MKLYLMGRIFNGYKVDRKNASTKPIEPITRVERITPANRDTVTFSEEGRLLSNKHLFEGRIRVTIDLCVSLIDRYEKFAENEKHEHIISICTVKEFKARLETFQTLLSKRTSKSSLEDLFEQMEIYFYRIDMALPTIAEEINSVEIENKKGLK